MNTKVLLAALAAFLFFFFGGWLVYGMLLADFMKANVTEYPGLMVSPEAMDAKAFAYIGLSNLAFGLLVAILADKTNSRTFMTGFSIAATIGFLVTLGYDAGFLAMWNLFSLTYVAVDLVVGTLFIGVGGGIAGLVLGYGKKA